MNCDVDECIERGSLRQIKDVVGFEAALHGGDHSMMSLLFGHLPSRPGVVCGKQYFNTFVMNNNTITKTLAVMFRGVRSKTLTDVIAEILTHLPSEFATQHTIDMGATKQQWFGLCEDPALYGLINDRTSSVRVPCFSSLKHQVVDKCVSIVFVSAAIRDKAVAAITQSSSIEATVVSNMSMRSGADGVGGLVRLMPHSISLIQPDHQCLFNSAQAAMPNALWFGGDGSDYLFHRMSRFRMLLQELEGSLILHGSGHPRLCVRFTVYGIMDGSARRSSNRQGGAGGKNA